MLTTELDDTSYRIHYRSYGIALVLLLITPLMIYHHGGSIVDGSIDASDLAGLVIALIVSLAGAYYTIEFSSFTFSTESNTFSWRWRSLLRKKSGEVALQRIVRIRREALESSGTPGSKYTYRLIVILDDDSVIPLTSGYSKLYDARLNQIAEQLRGFLGLVVPRA